MSTTVMPGSLNPTAKDSAPLSADTISKSSTRLRKVVVVDKRSIAEMVSGGGIAGVGKDRITTNRIDPSNTLGGDAKLEKQMDLSHVKNGVITFGISPQRRKSTPRPQKSRWESIFNIMIKIILFLGLLFWLGQAIWRWDEGSRSSVGVPFDALDLKSRISELDASLRKSAKAMQTELDVLDKKTRYLEEKGAIFENAMAKITARADSVDKFLSQMQDTVFVSKREHEMFLKELKESKSSTISGNGLSLDDVMNHAKEVIMKEIEKHEADVLGRIDYASASGGAKVVRHSEPYNLGKAGNWLPVAKGRNSVHGSAQRMLEPSFGEPGHCFPLQGSMGFVEIKLRTGIVPNAITLEHVAKSVAYDRSSAPKYCRVSGWFQSPEENPLSRTQKIFLLKEFAYDLEKSNVQTFNFESPSSAVVNMVRLDFSSNYGSLSHTCIYRFRVHGYKLGSSMLNAA